MRDELTRWVPSTDLLSMISSSMIHDDGTGTGCTKSTWSVLLFEHIFIYVVLFALVRTSLLPTAAGPMWLARRRVRWWMWGGRTARTLTGTCWQCFLSSTLVTIIELVRQKKGGEDINIEIIDDKCVRVLIVFFIIWHYSTKTLLVSLF